MSFVELCYDVNTRVFVFRRVCVLYIHNLLCYRHTVTITNSTEYRSLANRTLQKMLKGKRKQAMVDLRVGKVINKRHKLQSYSTYRQFI